MRNTVTSCCMLSILLLQGSTSILFNTFFVAKNHKILLLYIMYFALLSYCHYVCIYISNDAQDVVNNLRNTAYWIVIYKSINETAKHKFKDTLIQ